MQQTRAFLRKSFVFRRLRFHFFDRAMVARSCFNRTLYHKENGGNNICPARREHSCTSDRECCRKARYRRKTFQVIDTVYPSSVLNGISADFHRIGEIKTRCSRMGSSHRRDGSRFSNGYFSMTPLYVKRIIAEEVSYIQPTKVFML